MNLKKLKRKLKKDFGWVNLESDKGKWSIDDLLKDTIQAIEGKPTFEDWLKSEQIEIDTKNIWVNGVALDDDERLFDVYLKMR